MVDDPRRAVDEVTTELDGITTVEELDVNSDVAPDSHEMNRLRLALEDGGDAGDAGEDEPDEPSGESL